MDNDRLEQLKQAAEAQMRRPAPPIRASGPAAKRQRTNGDAAAPAAEDQDEEQANRVARFNYAAPEALLEGCTAFLFTCGLSRQMSATKEGLERIKAKLPEGASCSLVKVGCRGLVVVLVHPPGGQQAGKQGEEADAPGEEPGEGVQALKQERPPQQERRRRDAIGVVDVAASILADVEAGEAPHTRFIQRIIPAQTTCLLQAEPLREAAEAVCREFVAGLGAEAEGEGFLIEYAVAWKNRCFEGGAEAPAAAPVAARKQQARGGKDKEDGRPGEDGIAHAAQQPGATGGASAQAKEAGGGEQVAAPPPRQQQQQQQQASAPLQRQDAIAILAAALSAATGGRAKANLKDPKVTLIAEVVPVMVAGTRHTVVGLAAVASERLVSAKSRLQVRPISLGGK